MREKSEMSRIKVLDLNAGLGGRAYAFMKAGLKVVGVVESDLENCAVISSWLDATRIINGDLLEMDSRDLPDADLITAKYIQQSFSVLKKENKSYDMNLAIYNVIAVKRPYAFLLEVPVGSLMSKRQVLEEYMHMFYELGYEISYRVYEEMFFSGYPIIGKQGYIVGIKPLGSRGFEFPKPIYSSPQKEITYEEEYKVDDWYRIIKFNYDEWEKNTWYIRTPNGIKKTDKIHMGFMRENYLGDSLGGRRFTHNELAALKGLVCFDFNKCKNKGRMYTKIATASSVYTTEAIANAIVCFLQGQDKFIEKDNIHYGSNQKVKGKDKVLFPKRITKGIDIKKLKGINNLSLRFDKRLVAIMGVNGSGKSTIIHALACAYSIFEKGENHKFSYFFTPNPDASWNGSELTVINYDENEAKEIPKEYKKKEDRWARYSSRPQRDVFYIGVSSCIPEIEVEKRTSFIDYESYSEKSKSAENVIKDASYILNKDYEGLLTHTTGKKKYIGVQTRKGVKYSALSMGAGEQRVIKLLQTVYDAHQYSLVLVDEIDLLLHVDALRKLVIRLAEIAEKKNMQIIFTTHSLEMEKLKDYVDIRYIEHCDNKMLVYDSIKPELLYKLSGQVEQLYSIYVEDAFAAAIVREITQMLKMQRYVSIIVYGSIENAFTVAAGKVLEGKRVDNILVVTDGDKFVTREEKEKRIQSILTGTEADHPKKIEKALSMITQFDLPESTSPEEFVHSMLITMDDSHECVECAKNITSVKNSHDWIGEIVKQLGDENDTYIQIMSIVSEHEGWAKYVKSVWEWLSEKKNEIRLESLNE